MVGGNGAGGAACVQLAGVGTGLESRVSKKKSKKEKKADNKRKSTFNKNRKSKTANRKS